MVHSQLGLPPTSPRPSIHHHLPRSLVGVSLLEEVVVVAAAILTFATVVDDRLLKTEALLDPEIDHRPLAGAAMTREKVARNGVLTARTKSDGRKETHVTEIKPGSEETRPAHGLSLVQNPQRPLVLQHRISLRWLLKILSASVHQ